MWKLGNIEVNSRVVLAPMAGFTSSGYRKFFARFGVGLTYTEMVSDMGLIYDNKETVNYLPLTKEEVPVGIQLFGSEPENFKNALKQVKKYAKQVDFIDVNMGCPMPKVVKTGAGSALMKDPKKCGEIIKAIKSEIDVPVTAKIRLGWDDKSINFLEVIKELELAGVSAIAIHARTRSDLYAKKPRYELIKDLRNKMSVPLIVSGDIYTLDDAINALETTKAEAVMVARGTLGNPFLAKQIDTYFKTGIRLPNPELTTNIGWCLRLAQDLILEKGETGAMLIYRTIAPRFFSGLPNVKVVKSRLASGLNKYDDLKNIIINYLEESLPGISLETWDLFDKELTKSDTYLIRGEKVPTGLYHPVSDIIVENEDGTFLVTQRDYGKPRGGEFEVSAGGSILRGETPLAGAIRELKEETGIEATSLTFLGTVFSEKTSAVYFQYYLKDKIIKDKIELQLGENIAYRWVNKAELLEMINTNKLTNQRINRYLEKLIK